MKRLIGIFLITLTSFLIFSCTEKDDIKPNDPNDPTLDSLNFSCVVINAVDSVNGKIVVNVTGGVKPYKYKLDSCEFITDSIFDGLSPKTYSITVIDSKYNEKTKSIIVGNGITGGDEISVIYEKISDNETENDWGNGKIEFTVTGGIKPYTIKVYSQHGTGYIIREPNGVFQESVEISGLNGGNWNFTIQDNNGDSISIGPIFIKYHFSIDNITPTHINNISYNGNIKVLILSENNGYVDNAPYTYILKRNDTIIRNMISQEIFYNFSLLKDGMYTVEVIDKYDRYRVKNNIEIRDDYNGYRIGDEYNKYGITGRVFHITESDSVLITRNIDNPVNNWQSSVDYINGLSGDWYMPSLVELNILMERSQNYNNIKITKGIPYWTFTNCEDEYYHKQIKLNGNLIIEECSYDGDNLYSISISKQKNEK